MLSLASVPAADFLDNNGSAGPCELMHAACANGADVYLVSCVTGRFFDHAFGDHDQQAKCSIMHNQGHDEEQESTDRKPCCDALWPEIAE
jgi:hypothetical protein